MFSGDQPVEFQKGQVIDVKSIAVSRRLPEFCWQNTRSDTETFSDTLRDFTFSETHYKPRMAENINCKLECNNKDVPTNWNPLESKEAMSFIKNESRVHL